MVKFVNLLTLIYFSILVYLTKSDCLDLSCSSNLSQCKSGTGTSITLNPSACDSGEECVYYDEFRHAECMPTLSSNIPIFLYPGYYCSYYDGASCIYAGKYCNNGICDGKHRYDQCYESADCYYGHFCYKGICMPEKNISDYCTSHEACGRSGYCLFSNADVNFGYCVEYFSIPSTATDPILAYDSSAGTYSYQEMAEKVCETGWLDLDTGRCAEALTSTNKGDVCLTDTDCPTSDPGTFATCKCAMDGNMRCDIEGGDSEWQSAISNFKSYLSATSDCHSAEHYGECMETPEYVDWFCSEFKAKYYTYKSAFELSCFSKVMKTYNEFSEYYRVCVSDSAYGMFVAYSAIGLLTLLILF